MRYLLPGTSFLAMLALAGCGAVIEENQCPSRAWIPVQLDDASFDAPGGWTADPLANTPICDTSQFGITPDSGTDAACFGVANQVSQTLSQIIALPAGTTQLRLRGKRCLVTTEPPEQVKDTLVIELRDGDTLATAATLASWSNLDAGEYCAWEVFEVMAPVTVEPERPMLYLHGQTDAAEVTTFFLDTLVLDAYGCEA